MKLILIFSFLILPFFVFQFSGCSVSKQTNSHSASLENKAINSPSKTPRITDNTSNVAEQNFIKEWREKYDTTLAELERNRKLWQENKIMNYDFVIAKYAGGASNSWNYPPVLIKIREGEKVSIEQADKDLIAYFPSDEFKDFDTIDKLFDYMRQELDDRNILRVKYDKKYGYPKTVSIIFTFADIHNSHTIDISKFKVIK